MRANTQRSLSLLLAAVLTAPLAAQEIGALGDLSIDTNQSAGQPTANQQRIGNDFQLVVETIRERFPDGTIKLQREVARTIDLDYVNHGQYTMWNKEGEVIANGQFDTGRRTGRWTRTYQAGEGALFAEEPYKQFEGPFLSEANFQDGRLHGTWIITDGLGRKISEINYQDGLRHGKMIQHFPSGQVAREVDYENGNVHGMDMSYDEDGNVLSEYKYVEGRRHALKTTYYLGSKGKKQEIYYLHPQVKVAHNDDWWNATLAAQISGEGEPVRHGTYEAWHVNGQMSVQGEYRFGAPHGQFTWWHANGQINIRGAFADGKHAGMWHWWHPNGMKKSEGIYDQGQPAGRWLTWADNGKLAKIKNYDEEAEGVTANVADAEAGEVGDDANASAQSGEPELLRMRSARGQSGSSR